MQHYSLRSYSIGFSLALALSLSAFGLVWAHRSHAFLSQTSLIACILTLAVIQLFVQLVFFLHVGQEQKPRWNLAVFLGALLVIGIVVGGSLWIMSNLDYHMTSSPQEMQKYLNGQDDL
ncbi:MAG TPA: cytochrome o ubiquinol oxidase subunit IV [Candidatus Saccharimonadales bacterium]|nr:cytochrome o ubiquinol oxidase subunit IV [Candidatus Saccharimonadales bacterium]